MFAGLAGGLRPSEVPKCLEETQFDPNILGTNCLNRGEMVADRVPGSKHISCIPKSQKEKPHIPSWHGRSQRSLSLRYTLPMTSY